MNDEQKPVPRWVLEFRKKAWAFEKEELKRDAQFVNALQLDLWKRIAEAEQKSR